MVHFGSRRTVKKLLAIGEFSNADKVLDLGGGVGRIAKKLAPYVSAITVADVAEGMIRQCKKNNSITCVLLADDVLPFSDEYFDKVIMIHSFHHFARQKESILQVKRVLKMGGLAILDEINTKAPYGKITEISENITGIKHNFLAPSELEFMWNKQGFTTKLYNKNRGSYYLVAKRT